MPTNVNKISSNVVGLRYQEETSIGVANASNDWIPLEPNSFKDIGGDVKTVARNPINAGRQRKKGTVVDVDAVGGFVSDLTQTNLADLFQGLFFASFRRKVETGKNSVANITSVTSTTYAASSGSLTTNGFKVGDLVKGKGFAVAANNGLFKLTAVATGAVTTSGLTAEASAPSGSGIVQVGFEFGAGEVNISTPGGFPRLTRVSGSKNMTDFGLVPGETIFMGGDGAAEKWSTAANNGWCRVRSVTATYIEFDKTQNTLVAETDVGNAKTIRIFFGRHLKNETGTNIVRRSYQIERTLGVPDTAQPSQVQSEYLVGAVVNSAQISLKTADKITVDIDMPALDAETRTGAQGLKAGNRPTLTETDAFNTSNDVARIKLATVVPGTSNPSALFSYIENLDITVNNNLSPDKAISVVGAFDMSEGNFEVSMSMNAYFADVTAIAAVRANSDITLDAQMWKANAGVAIDIPLMSLGDGKVKVEQNTSIKIPLTGEAATGAKVDPTLDYTMSMVFFDYLPNLAS